MTRARLMTQFGGYTPIIPFIPAVYFCIFMHIPHLAPDTGPTPEAFAALVLTPELILL